MKHSTKIIGINLFIASFCFCICGCSFFGPTERYEQSTTTPPVVVPKDLSSSTVKNYYLIPAIPKDDQKQIRPDIKPPGLKKAK